MSQQLDLLGADDRIIPTALHSEMQRSYLEYAMSVIVGRALPDVRDGLKPVHRRILFAMHELGLTPDRPFRKCARVVGDVLGKYHPHGDQSVYDALVRLVQDFSSRYPLLGGHGNFGSIDNDPPAAMRYTETRLSGIGYEAVLGEINGATVDFVGNFDNSQQEPTVLPAEFPLLLVNGCSGIAVGMATNVPPHNLGEIIDGTIALIDNPNLSDEELWTIIPGPDFPTGGEIVGNEGICEAYRTGRGIITVRGVIHYEEAAKQAKTTKHRKRRNFLVVTELPFQVNKAGWIERIAELVNAGKIEDIADLRDESDRDGMRVVIELKRDSNHQKVIENLYRQTALQSNFGAIFLAIVDGLPKQLSLREALQEFLKFREETLTRQYSKDLENYEQRDHIVTGLTIALDNLDQTIEILRHAPDGTTAKMHMVEQLDLSESQADAILAMPMRRLTGMERQGLANEAAELAGKIAGLRKLLQDRKELLKSMKKDLRALRKKHGDERRTKIINARPIAQIIQEIKPKKVATIDPIDPITPEAAITFGTAELNDGEVPIEIVEIIPDADFEEPISLDTEIPVPTIQASTIKELPPTVSLKSLTQEFNEIALDRKPPISNEIVKIKTTPTSRPRQISLLISEPAQLMQVEFTKQGWARRFGTDTLRLDSSSDMVIDRHLIMSDQDILVIGDHGKAYPLKVSQIPLVNAQSDSGVAVHELLPGLANTNIVQYLNLPTNEDTNLSALILVTAQGRIKRMKGEELAATTSRGLALIKLQETDRLLFVLSVGMAKELVVGTSMGRLLRFTISNDQIPMQGRPSQGVAGLRVGSKEQLVNAMAVQANDRIMLLTNLGYSKQIPVTALRAVPIGISIGDRAMTFSQQTEYVAGMLVAQPGVEFMVTTDQQRLLPINVDQVPVLAKEGAGDRLVDLLIQEQAIALHAPVNPIN
jgi:DNA gyrase subunit A